MFTRWHVFLAGAAAIGALSVARLAGAGSVNKAAKIRGHAHRRRVAQAADARRSTRCCARSGTERPFTSPLLNEHRAGTFACAGCDLPLFSSKTKFDSGTGWPSFWAPLDNAVDEDQDRSFGMSAHGRSTAAAAAAISAMSSTTARKPTGLRYCMNGVALKFVTGRSRSRADDQPGAGRGGARASRILCRRRLRTPCRSIRATCAGMSFVNPNPFTTRPEIDGTFGVVASTHWIATAVGMAILENGGNAFDAAVATAFTLQVVEPHLNGPGGDVPVIVYDARARQAGSDLRPGPGAGRRHHRALSPRGSRPRARHRACLPPACPARSRPGCCCCATTARCRSPTCWRRRSATRGTAIRWSSAPAPPSPRSRSCSATTGRPRPRSICRAARCRRRARCSPIKQLAATYVRILKEAESAGGDREAQIERARAPGRQGFVAEAIDRFCRTQEVMDVERRAPPRRAHRPTTWRAGGRRRGAAHLRLRPLHACCKAGPWSQGPVMLQQLALLKGFDLDGLDPTSAGLHPPAVECAKLAFADREAFYGDPDFVDVPMATLLSDAYNAERRKLVARHGLAGAAPRQRSTATARS